MKGFLFASFFFFSLLHFSQGQNAIATLQGTEQYSSISGYAFFSVVRGGTQVKLSISGVPDALSGAYHAFHVHEFGDISDPDGMSTGNHFNPTNVSHGCPGLNDTYHVGWCPKLFFFFKYLYQIIYSLLYRGHG